MKTTSLVEKQFRVYYFDAALGRVDSVVLKGVSQDEVLETFTQEYGVPHRSVDLLL